ncbi:hypothetical protein A0H81_03793 [Grifola frondosa]|uniref:Uncharacterized protein n=1 Tax=Grifola frondosa TaxID=5627 RepID=A0A1C7MJD8_GRIFR|nr:hypothetical protein A0H81_03793 [Grifola frondosa]
MSVIGMQHVPLDIQRRDLLGGFISGVLGGDDTKTQTDPLASIAGPLTSACLRSCHRCACTKLFEFHIIVEYFKFEFEYLELNCFHNGDFKLNYFRNNDFELSIYKYQYFYFCHHRRHCDFKFLAFIHRNFVVSDHDFDFGLGIPNACVELRSQVLSPE